MYLRNVGNRFTLRGGACMLIRDNHQLASSPIAHILVYTHANLHDVNNAAQERVR